MAGPVDVVWVGVVGVVCVLVVRVGVVGAGVVTRGVGVVRGVVVVWLVVVCVVDLFGLRALSRGVVFVCAAGAWGAEVVVCAVLVAAGVELEPPELPQPAMIRVAARAVGSARLIDRTPVVTRGLGAQVSGSGRDRAPHRLAGASVRPGVPRVRGPLVWASRWMHLRGRSAPHCRRTGAGRRRSARRERR